MGIHFYTRKIWIKVQFFTFQNQIVEFGNQIQNMAKYDPYLFSSIHLMSWKWTKLRVKRMSLIVDDWNFSIYHEIGRLSFSSDNFAWNKLRLIKILEYAMFTRERKTCQNLNEIVFNFMLCVLFGCLLTLKLNIELNRSIANAMHSNITNNWIVSICNNCLLLFSFHTMSLLTNYLKRFIQFSIINQNERNRINLIDSLTQNDSKSN